MFETPHSTGPVASLADYVQPTLSHGLRIWWAFYWPTALAAFVLAIGFNSAMRLFLQIGVIPDVDIVPVIWISRLDLYVFYYLVAFFAMAYILRKKFRSFRIGLLSNYGGEGAERLRPTMRRTARVWWAFSWRAVIYRLIAMVAAWLPIGWIMGLISAIVPRGTVPFFNLGIQIAIDGAVGMFVIYSSILDEDIADFRVALLPRTPKPEVVAVPSPSASAASE